MGDINLQSEILSSQYYGVAEICEVFSVSKATIYNWIKLKKIKPDYKNKYNQPFFSKEYIEDILNQINSNKIKLLKSRRNKKFITGSFYYKDYINTNSINNKYVQNLLNFIYTENIKLLPQEINYILADCAIQLLIQKNNVNKNIKTFFLLEYLINNVSFDKYDVLIDDLIEDKNAAKNFILKNKNLFKFRYRFEKGEDLLGLIYISLSNLAIRKARGAYYTPTNIVKRLLKYSYLDKLSNNNKKILDPCCGTGNFLLQLPNNIKLDQIYGFDIDKTSIILTRLNILLNYKVDNLNILYKNFSNVNFLNINSNHNFDFIIGNPPWGYDFNVKEVQNLKKRFLTAKNKYIESFDVFVEQSLNKLNIGGKLLFVLPESFLSVKTHQNIRKIILKISNIEYIDYLGNIFSGVQCPCVITGLKKTNEAYNCVGTKIITNEHSFTISKSRKITHDIFNLNIQDNEYEILEKITNVSSCVYLKDNAAFALGIVTGNNKKYLSKIKTNNNEKILKGVDISRYKIQNNTNFIDFIPDKYQQVAPINCYRANEKLVYRFINKKLEFAYDDKKLLTLNSCNILIPKINGLKTKYILAVLNSTIIQYFYQKKFNSIKVLKLHIESIPIPICDNTMQDEIISLVNKIENSNNIREFERIYNLIDKKILNLYNLSENDYNVILNTINRD